MTSNETPTPGTDGELRDGERFVYIDEAPNRTREIDEMIEDAKASGGKFVGAGGERMAPDEDSPRRFVAKDEAEPSAHLTPITTEPFGMTERWAAHMATTTPSEPGGLNDGEFIYGPEGGGKMTVAESLAMLEARKAARGE